MIERQEYIYMLSTSKTMYKVSRGRSMNPESPWTRWSIERVKDDVLVASFTTLEEVEAYFKGIVDQPTKKTDERLVDIPIW
jgi:hypothetical protein